MDPKPWNRQPTKGSQWPSHDEVCAKHEQQWRLLQGPEPSALLGLGDPSPMLRFAPYKG